jgi:hypothetical protein
MEPASEKNLNNRPVVGLAERCGVINLSGHVSGEERIPIVQIIIRPWGEAVPDSEKRVRSARSTAGRDPEAKKRLGGSPRPPKKTDYARPVIIPNAIPTPHTKVPSP